MTPTPLFDRAAIARRLARRPGAAPDFVTAMVLDDLGERLMATRHRFARAALIGPDPRGFPAQGLSGGGPIAFSRFSTLLPVEGLPLVPAEPLSLPETGYDLIVSLFDLQIVDDVPGFLSRARAHLAPDGLLLAAAVGGESLKELRAAFIAAESAAFDGAFARVAPMIAFDQAAGLLQRAGLALPVADIETHRVRYADPLALMREIKALGAANPLAERPRRPMTRALLASALEHYADLAGDPDGRVGATLEFLWFSGWAPHESQPRPLRPGSATISMGEAIAKARGPAAS
ncbi:MAG: SAM-dependent methyltransferase [Devosia sp.]